MNQPPPLPGQPQQPPPMPGGAPPAIPDEADLPPEGTELSDDKPRQFPCMACGAELTWNPGQRELACQYCGHSQAIPQSEEDIEEEDFDALMARLAEEDEADEECEVRCNACGAQVSKPPGLDSFPCPYCTTSIVDSAGRNRRLIKPKSLLPFQVEENRARAAFRTWIGSLWFAPSALKKMANLSGPLKGVYIPHWTYDARTISHYTGQRGVDYWTTETYTTTENGRSVTKTRQVKRTRWYRVSGTVGDTFDDVLVLASRTLPQKEAKELEPWDLQNLVPYTAEYLSGHTTEIYQVDPKAGFAEARQIMDEAIRRHVKRDIGGDHQRISTLRTSHHNVTYKHILLPVWVAAYRFNDRAFRVLVNARTAEVQGERPWSWVKISLAILAGLIVLGGIIYAIVASQ